MTGFIVLAGLSLLVAAAFIAWPLLRRPGGTAEQTVGAEGERGDVNVQLYRSRVAEIERERDSGALDAAEAESLLHELTTTLLDDALAHDGRKGGAHDGRKGDTDERRPVIGGRSTTVAVALVALVALAAVVLYRQLGAYDAVQLAESAKILRLPDAQPAALADLVLRLRERVASRPDDAESWYLLGHALMRQDDAAGAVTAFERLFALAGDDASVQVALAQARFIAAGGTVTAANRPLIDRILAANPSESVVREMLALDAFRRADYADAVQHLEAALAGSATGERAEALSQGLERARALLGTHTPDAQVAGTAPAPPANTTTAAVRLSVAFAPGVDALPPARVFVIARAPDGPPQPIAVRALDPSTLPQQLILTDHDAMQPSRNLSMFDRVEVLARLSRSGSPTRQPGDVESPAQLLDPHGGAAVELIIGG
jgi:cytochrome c-type biogenesis protein CcmH